MIGDWSLGCGVQNIRFGIGVRDLGLKIVFGVEDSVWGSKPQLSVFRVRD